MATRKVTRRRLFKPQMGDLRERIEVGDNVLRPGQFGNAGAEHRYVKLYDAWARVETTQYVGAGEILFNGVNIAGRASHVFTLRYRADLTATKWIRWRDEAYRIEMVQHPDERNEFMQLFCYLEGDKDKKANT